MNVIYTLKIWNIINNIGKIMMFKNQKLNYQNIWQRYRFKINIINIIFINTGIINLLIVRVRINKCCEITYIRNFQCPFYSKKSIFFNNIFLYIFYQYIILIL